MRSVFLFLICFFICLTSCFSQDKIVSNKPSITNNYKYYNHKRTVQNTYGWISAGSGILLYGIGLSQPASNYYIDSDPAKGYPPSKRTPYFIAGTLAELACIPFFINANINKKKGAIALRNESALLFKANHSITYPSISFSLTL